MTPPVKLPRGTANFPSNGRLRTVAYGCGSSRTRKRRPANTPQPPDPQSVKREPFATHSGKTKKATKMMSDISIVFPLITPLKSPWRSPPGLARHPEPWSMLSMLSTTQRLNHCTMGEKWSCPSWYAWYATFILRFSTFGFGRIRTRIQTEVHKLKL